MNFLRYTTIMVIVLASRAYGVEVSATGVGSGTGPGARSQALTGAMREAIRQGIGVDLVSSSQVTNFELDYDRVLTSAFGYISKYSVKSQGVDEQGDYSVTITATVEKGRPKVDDVMALKTIISRKGSPRILIEATENIKGISSRHSISESILKEVALAIGLKVNSARKSLRNRNRRSAENSRGSNPMNDSDVIIYIDVEGSYNGEETVYGFTSKTFDISVTLEAIWTDTGDTIVLTDLPTKTLSSTMKSPEQAIRDSLKKVLEGIKGEQDTRLISNFYSKIISKWITELDLGSTIQVEIVKVRKPQLDKLLASLEDDGSVANIMLREFDLETSAILDIETKLNTRQLSDLIIKCSGDSMELSRSRKTYMRFNVLPQ